MGCSVAVGWIATSDFDLKIVCNNFITQPAAVPVTGKLKYIYDVFVGSNIMHKDMINYFLNL